MPRTRTRVTKLPTDFDALVRMHPPRVILDEAAYENTQEVVDALTGVPNLSQGQSEYLETLSVLMDSYEQENHAIEVSDLTPLQVLKYLMDENQLKPRDIGQIIGSASAASMILSGEREMSKNHVRDLSGYFRVDASLFL